jgi:hypothetical protein
LLAQYDTHRVAVYSGVMLTLLDERIEGIVRERILISYLRYKVLIVWCVCVCACVCVSR